MRFANMNTNAATHAPPSLHKICALRPCVYVVLLSTSVFLLPGIYISTATILARHTVNKSTCSNQIDVRQPL